MLPVRSAGPAGRKFQHNPWKPLLGFRAATASRRFVAYASPRRFVAYGSTIKPHLLSHPRRVRLDGLSKEERIEAVQQTLATLDEPTIVTGALPELDAGLWFGELVKSLGDRLTQFQVREREGTSLFEATFYDCLMECVGSSCHESAVFVLDEGILTESSAELRAQLLLPQDEWGDNWFSLFPKALRPSDCLLIGGRGARSTLHADPFSWHGYNYLLEGSKVWTFLPPQSSEALEAYTLEPNAWGDGDESMSIAVGQESPIDLYWDILVDEEELGEEGEGPPSGRGLVFGPSRSLDKDLMSMTVSFVQRESELLLIPPDWWHQTYHLCATVAVASQLMNPHVAQSVHSHILRWTGAERDIPLEALKQMEPSEQIRRVLHAACRRRHGPEEGDRVAAEMFGKGD